MARSKGSGTAGGGLTLLGINVERDLFLAVERWAVGQGVTKSEAGRRLLRLALTEGLPAQSSPDTGYNDGLRRGLREARVAIQAALVELWK